MRYILIDEKRRENALEYLKWINISKPVEVTIKPYRKNRSNAQNNLYHMWKKPIAEHFGYTEDELHEVLKVRFIGIEVKMVAGQKLVQPISTTSLDLKQMAEFLLKIEVLAKAHDITLKMPDDALYALYGNRKG